MVLDEILETSTIPVRDWNVIIDEYNVNNSPFPIPPIVCARIIQMVKEGKGNKETIFRQHGIRYKQFLNRYNKSKKLIEQLLSLPEMTDAQFQVLNTLRKDPAFILGEDIERVDAFHFNDSIEKLRDISGSPQAYERYIQITHPEQFEDKKENNNVQVVFKIQQGLIEAL